MRREEGDERRRQCDAVCCSVLQCVAVCCEILQLVSVCCVDMPNDDEQQEKEMKRGSVFQSVAECCRVLQCVAVCCSVLQCVVLTRRTTMSRRKKK